MTSRLYNIGETVKPEDKDKVIIWVGKRGSEEKYIIIINLKFWTQNKIVFKFFHGFWRFRCVFRRYRVINLFDRSVQGYLDGSLMELEASGLGPTAVYASFIDTTRIWNVFAIDFASTSSNFVEIIPKF